MNLLYIIFAHKFNVVILQDTEELKKYEDQIHVKEEEAGKVFRCSTIFVTPG